MNMSQLAVYQVPSEASKMRKRSTVPFYNRRRAVTQRDLHPNNTSCTQPVDKRTWTTTTRCDSVLTVTSTVAVTDCRAPVSSNSAALPNTTYVGSQSPYLVTPTLPAPTIDTWHAPSNTSPSSNCTCLNSPTVTCHLERHPSMESKPTPAQFSDPTADTSEIHKRATAWDRVAYYTSSAPAQATGLAFLANLGDPRQSGTFD